MKKMAANLALMGSLLITAAVLAPLFHGFDHGQTLGLLVSGDQAGRANLATAEVATRADISTGLWIQDARADLGADMGANAGVVANFCAQGGQITDLVCNTVAVYFLNE
jgi:hypothetical protein